MINDQERFCAVLKEAAELRKRKNVDYGGAWRRHGIYGLTVRLTDKMERINSLMNKKAQVNESIRDTAVDIVNYAAMMVMLLDEQGQKK